MTKHRSTFIYLILITAIASSLPSAQAPIVNGASINDHLNSYSEFITPDHENIDDTPLKHSHVHKHSENGEEHEHHHPTLVHENPTSLFKQNFYRFSVTLFKQTEKPDYLFFIPNPNIYGFFRPPKS
ncbi:MAG: hypothetical protein AB8E15_04900 [Bdellovibrionales bacterium]